MSNYLEELAAEFYEYKGCFVRRNIRVNKRTKGGYEGELDVIAYNPEENIIYHIEATMDAGSWEKREKKYMKKFSIGKKAIPVVFKKVCKENPTIMQVILLGYGNKTNHNNLAGGKVVPIQDFLCEIITYLQGKDIYKEAVPENYPLLRTIQFILSKGLINTKALPKKVLKVKRQTIEK